MTMTLPDTIEGFEDVLGDDNKIAAMFENGRPKPEFGEFLNGYVKKITARDKSLDEQIKDQVNEVFAEFLKDNGQAVRKVNLDHRNPVAAMPTQRAERYKAIYNRKAPGAAADDMFDGWGEYARATYHRADRFKDYSEIRTKLDKLNEIRNAYGSTIPADGGFLIPETLRAEVLSVALETAIMRPRARVIPMETLRVPFPTIDSTSNASSVHGGIQAFWTEEAGSLIESQSQFGRVVLDAKKLTALAAVPNELYTDSLISLEAFIGQAYPEAITWFEDLAFIRGSGAGEPLGRNLAGNPARVSVAKEGAQAADTVLWANIVKMYARMLPTSLGRAVWVANLDVFPQLAQMADAGGNGIWIAQGTGSEGAPMTILGRPVIFTEKMETVGDQGDIAFVDPAYYLIGDRQAMTMESSTHARFTSDVTVTKFICRVDGRPWMQSPITPNKGAATLSPFVVLDARA